MKTLYFECNMGAAGDMLMAALAELVEDKGKFVEKMNDMGLEGVHVELENVVKCGITGSHALVRIGDEEEISEDVHEHSHVKVAEAHIHEHSHEHDEHSHAHEHDEHDEHSHAHEGHDHEEHSHTHEGHDGEHSHAYEGHDHEEHSHTHEGHDHEHEEHSHAYEGHDHEEHSHTHEGHDHEHDEHSHAYEGHDHEEHIHTHEGHDHEHEEHSHAHEGHGHEHEEHSHAYEGHDHHHNHGEHAHHHSGMADIERIINNLNVSDKVKHDAMNVYGIIAEAESHAHGRPVTEIHFHEVGAMDAVADIVGVCMLMEEIGAEKIVASPIHVGSGQVRCAHGILPVPAPATAYILQGVPIYGGRIKGELCTPTGAALLKYFANEFGSMPVMTVSKTGYGMGKKDFEDANCVRVFFGDDAESENVHNGDERTRKIYSIREEKEERLPVDGLPETKHMLDGVQEGLRCNERKLEITGSVLELCCNLDDMTGEDIAFAQEELFLGGALDVYTTTIGMKKGRPAIMLTCMCRSDDKEKMLRLIFKHTTTLGIREYFCKRYTLLKEAGVINTSLGEVHMKTSSGYGAKKSKPEYEDLARLARENNMSLAEVRSRLTETLGR